MVPGAGWRTVGDNDPSRPVGDGPVARPISGCGGDIGTHAYEFVRFVAGLTAVEVSARLKSFVPGRSLDDDFTVLARLNSGAVATIGASMITVGAQNDNGFRVIGDRGTVEWSMLDHMSLKVFDGGGPVKVYRLGGGYAYFPESMKGYLRLPSGHPEGFHEALANLHKTAVAGRPQREESGSYPRPMWTARRESLYRSNVGVAEQRRVDESRAGGAGRQL